MASVLGISELLKDDMSKVKMWLTSDDCTTNYIKTANLLYQAMLNYGCIDICQCIIRNG